LWRVSLARPSPQRAQRDWSLVAPPRRVRQALSQTVGSLAHPPVMREGYGHSSSKATVAEAGYGFKRGEALLGGGPSSRAENQNQFGSYPMQQPVVRVSILRCVPEKFAEFRHMMIEADAVLRPGIESMPGLIHYYAGADEATSSLMNVSIWKTLDNAKQM